MTLTPLHGAALAALLLLTLLASRRPDTRGLALWAGVHLTSSIARLWTPFWPSIGLILTPPIVGACVSRAQAVWVGLMALTSAICIWADPSQTWGLIVGYYVGAYAYLCAHLLNTRYTKGLTLQEASLLILWAVGLTLGVAGVWRPHDWEVINFGNTLVYGVLCGLIYKGDGFTQVKQLNFRFMQGAFKSKDPPNN